MEILPIRSLSREDSPVFGKLNVLLGQLIRVGITDIEGFVVEPPSFKIKTALEYFNLGHRELFEQSLNLVKKHLLSQPIPKEFSKVFRDKKRYFFEGKVYVKSAQLWQDLINSWVGDLKQMVNLVQPDAKLVCVVGKVKNYGVAYWDAINSLVVVKDALKSLNPELKEAISEQTVKANKKLMIPYKYDWILDGDKIKISGIGDDIHNYEQEIIVKKPYELLSVAEKTVLITKIYQSLTDDIIIKEFDGVFAGLKIDNGPAWFEANVPEHILNIDKYIGRGIYGVVINLNEIIKHVYDTDTSDTFALKNLFNTFFEKLHKAKLSALVLWESQDFKFLEYLIAKGVRGVIIKRHDLDVMQDLLSKIEKRILLLGQTQK